MKLTLTLAGPMEAMVEALAQARGISHQEAVRCLLGSLLNRTLQIPENLQNPQNLQTLQILEIPQKALPAVDQPPFGGRQLVESVESMAVDQPLAGKGRGTIGGGIEGEGESSSVGVSGRVGGNSEGHHPPGVGSTPLRGTSEGEAPPAQGSLLGEQEGEQARRPAKRRGPPQTGPLPDIPVTLDCPAFRQAWELRLLERREKGAKGRLTPSQVTAQFRSLEKLARECGLGAAIGAVEEATANGWQGVVFPKYFNEPPTPSRPPGPTPRQLAEAETLELQRQLRELTSDVLPNSDPEFEATMDLHDAAGKFYSLVPALKERIAKLEAIRATMTPEQVQAVREESAKAMREAFSVDLSSVILGGA